jgi:hypothetical protein
MQADYLHSGGRQEQRTRGARGLRGVAGQELRGAREEGCYSESWRDEAGGQQQRRRWWYCWRPAVRGLPALARFNS